MGYLIRLYRFANLLSLDVAIGSVCCSAFFLRVFEQRVEVSGMIALFLTVWIIYTADHLRDARLLNAPSTARHRFHKKHFNTLLFAVGIALVFDLVVLFFLSGSVIIHGVLTILFVSLYLLFQKRLHPLKELLIAVFYLAGILTPSVHLLKAILENYMLLLSFTLVAFLNLVLFSWFDYKNDVVDTTNSIATFLGQQKVIWIIGGLFFVICLITAFHASDASFIIIWTMGFLHVLIFVFHRFFSRDERFRLAGDAIFFLPGIFLLFQM